VKSAVPFSIGAMLFASHKAATRWQGIGAAGLRMNRRQSGWFAFSVC